MAVAAVEKGASSPAAFFTVKFEAVATVAPSPSYGLNSAAPEIMIPIVPRLAGVDSSAFTGLVGMANE